MAQPDGNTTVPEDEAMAFDPLAVLRSAGTPVDLLPLEQQEVFARLTENEVAVLVSIQERLNSLPEAEVEAHGCLKIL
jgi:hypothetical protein